MTITVSPTKIAGARSLEALSIEQLADSIRDEALTLAQDKYAVFQRGSDLASLFRHPDFFEKFKYGLAVGVAGALAANDQNLLAAYVYDPSTNPDSENGEELPLEATLHLLALVSSPSAALNAFVASLDRALTASLKDLPSPLFARRESVLDVNLITEKDARLGVGYAALLSSLFAPPLKVWTREA
jgi:hypothetical protein